jgi:hypothetical protein
MDLELKLKHESDGKVTVSFDREKLVHASLRELIATATAVEDVVAPLPERRRAERRAAAR